MNRRIIAPIIIVMAVLSAGPLAWQQHNIRAQQQTQQEFTQLIKDIAPHLKPNPRKIRTISKLLDNLKTTNAQLEQSPLKSEAAAADLAATKAKKEILDEFQPRFNTIKPRHLEACQREDLYRYWGTLDIWQSWLDTKLGLSASPDNAALIYEEQAGRSMGRPAIMSEIKAVGEEEFTKVTKLLEELADRVQSEFGLDLHSFAQEPNHYSDAEEDVQRRSSEALERVETAFEASGQFDFTSIPKGRVQVRRGYGPYNSIASYRKQDNAMVLFWADGSYNHKYDTMLAVHEIMPGHHLQIKTVKEPTCGKGPVHAQTAFLEGWATYAETLADEIGLFEAPDQRLGWLDYRLIRAMRIRLDMARMENTLTEAQARTQWEADMPERLHSLFDREWGRITQSRHHLSYIFGDRAILDAKNKLRTQLGPKFNEKKFHKTLLSSSHIHLLYLPERMAAQMQSKRTSAREAENTH